MVKKDEFCLIKTEINPNYKDQLLIELSNLNLVHIKTKEKLKIREELEEREPFSESIKILRKNLNTLLKKLNITDFILSELKINESERIEFKAKDLAELINHIFEEIDFYINRVNELKSYVDKGTIELENMNMLKACYKNLEKLNLTKDSLIDFKQFKFKVFTTFSKNLNNLKNLFAFTEFPNFYETFEISKDRIGFYIIYPKDKENEFNGRIRIIHSEEVPIVKKYLTETGINYTRIDKEINFIEKMLLRYYKELNRLGQDNLLKFAGINEIVQNIEEYHWADQQFEKKPTDRLTLKFFVPLLKKNNVLTYLFNTFKDNITIESIDISKKRPTKEIYDLRKGTKPKPTIKPKSQSEYAEEEDNLEDLEDTQDLRELTPTVMTNSFITKPFETLTKMYGTPTYSEIDPTPIIAVTFPILFGLMFGDIGHGLILIIAGFIGALVYRKRGGDIVNFSWIIFFCGWASFFIGFLYGEFFGLHDIEIFGNVLWHLEPITIPFLNITLYNPLHNILSVFYFAIIIGVFHINLGWFIQFLNYWEQHRKYLGFSDSLIKIFLLTGGTILIFSFGFDLSTWFAFPYPILLVLIPGILLLILKPLGKLFGISYLQKESFGGLLGEGSIEAFDTVLSVMSNVASYIRLLALALAHIALLYSINVMVNLIQGTGIGVAIINFIGLVFGNMIVILLEGLLVFLNTLRLHFYEFFFKFYQGSGIKYFPFYLDNHFSVIKFRAVTERDIISEEIEREIDTESIKEEIDKAFDYITKKFK